MKERKDGFLRELEQKYTRCRVWMALKSLVVALPFLLIALLGFVLWMIWLPGSAPETWQTENVRYARIDYRLSYGRGTVNSRYVLVTTDRREFTVSADVARALEDELAYGAVCEITFRELLWYHSVCGLSSGERIYIDRAEMEAQWRSDRLGYPRHVLIWLGLSAMAAGLGFALWCRKDRAELAQIRERIRVREEKNAIRAARKAGKPS